MAKIDLGTGLIGNEQRITLGLLTEVHNNEQVSQRSIASELSIALGLANTYLKRCVKKGLIKVKQAPANRYAYYLTPQGFAEKSRLTAEFFSQSLNLFRVSRDEATAIFAECAAKGFTNIAVMGDGDLVEIFAMTASSEVSLSHYSPARSDTQRDLISRPIQDIAELGSFDVLIICDMQNPIELYKTALAHAPAERIFSPAFLGLHNADHFLSDGDD
jgi:DNA-binding MarR family transcriptional regulator